MSCAFVFVSYGHGVYVVVDIDVLPSHLCATDLAGTN